MSREASSHAILTSQISEGRHLVLVGSNHQENLALQYLAASVEAAGYSVDLVGFNEREDAPTVLKRVRASKPLLVGIQIAFQYTVGDCLWLASALRGWLPRALRGVWSRVAPTAARSPCANWSEIWTPCLCRAGHGSRTLWRGSRSRFW